jgi:hypothetical protein
MAQKAGIERTEFVEYVNQMFDQMEEKGRR